MHFEVIWNNLPYLLQGLAVTVQTAGLVIIGGTILGIALGVARSARSRFLRLPAAVYIEFIRGTPLLVVLFIVYFAIPAATGFRFTAYEAAVIGFIAFITAYIAEDYRSGLAAVPRGLAEAGLASGLTSPQVLFLIVLPLAVRRMIPTLFGQLCGCQIHLGRLGDWRHGADRRGAHRQRPRVSSDRDHSLPRRCLFRALLSPVLRRAMAQPPLCGADVTE